MSLSETQAFLEDLLRRYDPGVDLTEGSRAQTEIVQPILNRIGLDPFDEDIQTFIREVIRQENSGLAISELDEINDTVVNPMRVIIEPLVREVKLAKLRSYLNNAENLSDDEVDALLGNEFASRRGGGYSRGVVRVFFPAAQSVSLSLLNYASTKGGLRFFVERPQSITTAEMLLNIDGTEYYFDVNYVSENKGDQYNVEAEEITAVANLPGASRVKNLRKFRDGVERETSAEFVARVQSSQGDKTMNTSPGILSVLSDSFPALKRLFTVGFRDPEMRRDVVTGGGMSTLRADDAFGPLASATAVAEDDGDGDFTSPILFDLNGHFVSRLGAAGSVEGWYITLFYQSGGDTFFAEPKVLSVIDDDRVILDHEFPLPGDYDVAWILRKRELTISNIPGGIVLPNGPSGSLTIAPDEVHIGGKVDVYVAGDTDDASATIEALGDEVPYAAGVDARTGTVIGELAQVWLVDIDADLVDDLTAGMSLVLDEGSDTGAYRIRRVVSTSPCLVELDQDMTGTQVGLIWRVVDTIDVTLTDPVAPKTEGADMVTSAGSPLVVSGSGANFLDSGVAKGDTLELLGGAVAGRYSIENVTAITLEVSPAPTLSTSAVAYRIYRRSEALQTPVVRVKSMELLDSAGAPTGVKIPYRHPVLIESRAFQNESSALLVDSTGILGAVSGVFVTASGSLTLDFRDVDAVWGAVDLTHTHSFVGSSPAAVAAYLNGALASELTAVADGGRVLIAARRHLTLSGSLLSAIGLPSRYTNASIRAESSRDDFYVAGVRIGDVVEVVTGAQAGLRSRVAATQDNGSSRSAELSLGPSYAHSPTLLNPAVGASIRVGRPSVGSARVYFLDPTTAEFPYDTARFVTDGGLEFRPDPTNVRVLYPAPPTTALPNTGSAAGTAVFTDASADFTTLGARAGDYLQILYRPIVSAAPLAAPPTLIPVAGTTLRLRLGTGPWIEVSFPLDMLRQAVADYINSRVGTSIASINGSGYLVLAADQAIEVDDTSTAWVLILNASSTTSEHPDFGSYVITGVTDTTLTCFGQTFTASTLVRYKVNRATQRASTTDMALNKDATQLYYVDVEMVSTAPGNQYNIVAGLELEPTGYTSEGYELYAENDVLTYSTAEVLKARLSRSILLDGSPDADTERTQLSTQNVLVSYDRSQLTQDIQSFCDAGFNRVLNAEGLVRHLLPHYVNLSWRYVAGPAEREALSVLQNALDTADTGGDTLEVVRLAGELTRRGAASVYVEDSGSTTGRAAPLLVVIYHDEDRRVRATVVRDVVSTVRMQRFIADNVAVRRTSTGGIR